MAGQWLLGVFLAILFSDVGDCYYTTRYPYGYQYGDSYSYYSGYGYSEGTEFFVTWLIVLPIIGSCFCVNLSFALTCCWCMFCRRRKGKSGIVERVPIVNQSSSVAMPPEYYASPQQIQQFGFQDTLYQPLMLGPQGTTQAPQALQGTSQGLQGPSGRTQAPQASQVSQGTVQVLQASQQPQTQAAIAPSNETQPPTQGSGKGKGKGKRSRNLETQETGIAMQEINQPTRETTAASTETTKPTAPDPQQGKEKTSDDSGPGQQTADTEVTRESGQ